MESTRCLSLSFQVLDKAPHILLYLISSEGLLLSHKHSLMPQRAHMTAATWYFLPKTIPYSWCITYCIKSLRIRSTTSSKQQLPTSNVNLHLRQNAKKELCEITTQITFTHFWRVVAGFILLLGNWSALTRSTTALSFDSRSLYIYTSVEAIQQNFLWSYDDMYLQWIMSVCVTICADGWILPSIKIYWPFQCNTINSLQLH